MPPINQQSSRGGLITAVAIFAILFIVAAVMAMNFYGKWQQKVADYDQYVKNYNGVVDKNALGSQQVAELIAAKGDMKLGITGNDTLFDVATKQTTALQSVIGAAAGQKPSDAVDAANAAVADAQKKLESADIHQTLPATGLISVINTLTDTAIARQREGVALSTQLKDANEKVAKATADIVAVNAEKDKAVAAANENGTNQISTLNTSLQATNATIDQIKADSAAHDKAYADASAAAQNEIANLKTQLAKDDTSIQSLQGRLGNRRMNVTNAVIQQTDGQIVRVPNTEICYINLGYGDQVTNGLTFEVYDKATGVPPIPDNVTGDEQLPVGKASIEITHVGTTSSECRIVKIQPGAIISEGDPIANLVYDPKTKYNFFVFGNFDLAENGRPNANDANFIKQLVTQWGGKLTDEVNVNTDFVVLGTEPVLPTFSKDDINPENQKKLDDAQLALDKYQEIRQTAKDLHIPILNQNRFLYYVGYYDQAKR